MFHLKKLTQLVLSKHIQGLLKAPTYLFTKLHQACTISQDVFSSLELCLNQLDLQHLYFNRTSSNVFKGGSAAHYAIHRKTRTQVQELGPRAGTKNCALMIIM